MPLPARGQAGLIASLFEPLGYAVDANPIPLDPAHPEWGDSPYVALRLTGQVRLAALLTHLFVLIPVLDNSKHYYHRRGRGREAAPQRRRVAGRSPTARADRAAIPQELPVARAVGADRARRARRPGSRSRKSNCATRKKRRSSSRIRLNDTRMERVTAVLKELGAASVLDLGCGRRPPPARAAQAAGLQSHRRRGGCSARPRPGG